MQRTESPDVLGLCGGVEEVPARGLEDEVARDGGEALELGAVSAGQKAHRQRSRSCEIALGRTY